MVTAEQIERLSQFKNQEHLISSLYLRLWPEAKVHRAKLKTLIREKSAELEQADQSGDRIRRVEEDLEKIGGLFEGTREMQYPGVAVFTSQPLKLWEIFWLTRPVTDLLVFDYSPYIRPLTSILSRYRRICTVLVNRTQARIFESFMGEIEERSEVFSEVPSRVREAGWYGLSEKRIDRHIDYHTANHFKKVVASLLNLFREKNFDWLFPGGQPEVLTEFENFLPPPLRQRLKRSFRIDMNVSPSELLKKSLELEQEIKKEEDQILVFRLANSLNPGGTGISGIQETLSSLHEGNVHTLVVEEGYNQEGARCSRCGFMGLNPGQCPLCQQKMIPVPDIVNEAVTRGIEQGCEVVHITSGIGLEKMDRIGALLRYRAATRSA